MTEADLCEIETIKQLKARYCRVLDTKQWAAWRAIFTDDFLSDTSEAGGKVIDGADEFVAFTRKSLRNQATVHQVHAPEIEITSATTARGVWALEDVVRLVLASSCAGTGTTPRPTRNRWAVAHHELKVDPLTRGCRQRSCSRVHLGSDAPHDRRLSRRVMK